MRKIRRCLIIIAIVGFVGLGGSAYADFEKEFNDVISAFQNGKFDLNVRARWEHAEVDGLPNSDAYTLRTALGYGTAQYRHLQGYIEYENVSAYDNNKYNAVVSGNPDRAIIADPEGTELKQVFLRYDIPESSPMPGDFIYGRQRIILDDQRFVGNVGWRQDEQVYDAIRFGSSFGVENLQFNYAWVNYVRRIFADELDSDTSSHFFNLSYAAVPEMKITAFDYWLDFKEHQSYPGAGIYESSNTYGFRLSGDIGVNDDVSIGYAGSYARQNDIADNPISYRTDYIAADLKLVCQKIGAFGTGLEMLRSDGGDHQFVTPLATAHKFNGWADVFTDNGGPDGLRDYYGYIAPKLPWGLNGQLVYHWFESDHYTEDAGDEIDVIVSKPINEHVTVLAKYADFDGDGSPTDSTASGRPDVNRFWLQAEFTF